MEPQEKLRNLFKAKTSPLFPIPYLKKMRELDSGFCLPGSVKIGTLVVPVIAIHVHPDGLDYFGIHNGPCENMSHRFRYLDNAKGDEVVQICLSMKENRELALNFDPLSDLTIRFLSDIANQRLFGFIFFCNQWKLFLSSYTSPDEEETSWIKRNITRAKKLKKNDFNKMVMDSMIYDQIHGVDERKYYLAEKGNVVECFYNSNSGSVPLEHVNEYIY